MVVSRCFDSGCQFSVIGGRTDLLPLAFISMARAFGREEVGNGEQIGIEAGTRSLPAA
jgi:hypothetical protein